jgi:N6-adenosine-specific RNA methylase IME4
MIPFSQIQVPDGGFDIIYADPPWSYYNDSDALPDCTTVRGMRRPPYPVLGSKTIASFPVGNLAAENSILFIWSTDLHLKKCMFVIDAWGFKYVTMGFVWQKLTKAGNPVTFTGGYTMKSGVELCLLATRGKPHKLVQNRSVRALIQSPRGKHSKKPVEVYERIEALFGNTVSRLELFARDTRAGWTSWGNQLDMADSL